MNTKPTNPLGYLAFACVAICGAVNGSLGLAQTAQTGFVALPPLKFVAENGVAEGIGQVGVPPSGRLFAIESPPQPQEMNAHARIVPQTVGPRVAAVPQAPIQLPVAAKSTASGRYLVSFAELSQDPGPAAVPAAGDQIEMPAFEMPALEMPALSEEEQEAEKSRDLELAYENEEGLGDDEGEVDGDGGKEEEEEKDEDAGEDDEGRSKREPRVFGQWPRKSISESRIDVRDFSAKVPEDESYVLQVGSVNAGAGIEGRSQKTLAWAAPGIRHQPLYFEDVSLERYGQTAGIVKQPFVSGFKFLRDGALLPLNAAIDCPGSCDTPLGFGRPGSPQPNGGCSSCQQ